MGNPLFVEPIESSFLFFVFLKQIQDNLIWMIWSMYCTIWYMYRINYPTLSCAPLKMGIAIERPVVTGIAI